MFYIGVILRTDGGTINIELSIFLTILKKLVLYRR
jgi:hypothetical protein